MRWWPTTREINIFHLSRSVRRPLVWSPLLTLKLLQVTTTDFLLYNSIAIAISKLTALTNKSKKAQDMLFFGVERKKHAFCMCFGHLPLSCTVNTTSSRQGYRKILMRALLVDPLPSNPLIFVSQFILLQCCYHNDIAFAPTSLFIANDVFLLL